MARCLSQARNGPSEHAYPRSEVLYWVSSGLFPSDQYEAFRCAGWGAFDRGRIGVNRAYTVSEVESAGCTWPIILYYIYLCGCFILPALEWRLCFTRGVHFAAKCVNDATFLRDFSPLYTLCTRSGTLCLTHRTMQSQRDAKYHKLPETLSPYVTAHLLKLGYSKY